MRVGIIRATGRPATGPDADPVKPWLDAGPLPNAPAGLFGFLAKASRSSVMRSRAFFSVSSRSLIWVLLSVGGSAHALMRQAAAIPGLSEPQRAGFAAVKAKIGAPDTIRTCDLCLRRATLYPAELRVRCASFSRLAGPRQRPGLGGATSKARKAKVTRSNRVGCVRKACAGRAGTVAGRFTRMESADDGSFARRVVAPARK